MNLERFQEAISWLDEYGETQLHLYRWLRTPEEDGWSIPSLDKLVNDTDGSYCGCIAGFLSLAFGHKHGLTFSPSVHYEGGRTWDLVLRGQNGFGETLYYTDALAEFFDIEVSEAHELFTGAGWGRDLVYAYEAKHRLEDFLQWKSHPSERDFDE